MSPFENCSVRQRPDLHRQISALENRFAELFAGEGCRDLLRQLHLQLKVLKAELEIQERTSSKTY